MWWNFWAFPTSLWSRLGLSPTCCCGLQTNPATKRVTLNLLSSFVAFVPTFLFFLSPLDHTAASPLLPVALWTPFQSFHEYIYAFAGEERVCCEGCRALCAGRLYWLWQESPPAPGRALQGQSCPQAQSNQQQSKSDPPPLAWAGKWQARTLCPAAIYN